MIAEGMGRLQHRVDFHLGIGAASFKSFGKAAENRPLVLASLSGRPLGQPSLIVEVRLGHGSAPYTRAWWRIWISSFITCPKDPDHSAVPKASWSSVYRAKSRS